MEDGAAEPGSLSRGHERRAKALTPTYHVFEMFQVHQGARNLAVDIQAEDYVLGGQKRAWPLSGPAAGKTLTIKAESDTGPIDASAVVSKGG